MKLSPQENKQFLKILYENVLLYEDEIPDELNEEIPEEDSEEVLQSKEFQDLSPDEKNGLLQVDSQIRNSNYMLKEIDNLIQAKNFIYAKVKEKMETDLGLSN